MTPRRIYLVYDGILSPVFNSQVLTPLCRLQDEGIAHDLIAFSSYRSLARRRGYKEQKRLVGERLRGRNIFMRTMPYHGSFSLVYPMMCLRLAMRRLGTDRDEPVVIQARGHQAAYMALSLRKRYPNLKVIANLRGVAGPEVTQYTQKGKRLDNRLTGSAQARSLEHVEETIVRESDSIICVSHAFKDYIQTTYGTPPDRIHVIVTAVDTEIFKFDPSTRADVRQSLGLGSKLVLTYCGSAHEWELPHEIIRVFGVVRERCADAHLLILTTHPAEFKEVVTAAGLGEESVSILSVPHSQVPDYLMAGDAGLLIRENNLVNNVAAPTKFGEYLACGLPVLVSKGIGDTEDVVIEQDTGWVSRDLSDESVESAADLIVQDRARVTSVDHKKHCAEVGRSLYSWDSHIPAFLEVYRLIEGSETGGET